MILKRVIFQNIMITVAGVCNFAAVPEDLDLSGEAVLHVFPVQ